MEPLQKDVWYEIAEVPAPKEQMLTLACATWPTGQVPIKTGYLTEHGTWKIFGASWTPTHWMYQPDPPPLRYPASVILDQHRALTTDQIALARIPLIRRSHSAVGLVPDEQRALDSLTALLNERVPRVSKEMWTNLAKSAEDASTGFGVEDDS
jgi:hypothetical protein